MADIVDAWLVGPGGTKIHTTTYNPADAPKAVLVFIHGFAEHIARYQHVFRAWAARGVAVFAYDQRGFGRTALDSERSADSAYGKTSFAEQISDAEWAVEHAKQAFEGAPVFLMGHSMGGGIALGFCTRSPPVPAAASLAGLIASSPLLLQTHPAPKALRFVGGQASKLLPNMAFKAEVNPDDLSHDKVVNEAYKKDPLVREQSTLRHLRDMLNHGEQVLWNDWKNLPRDLPVLILHGTDDKVTSCKATEEFYNKIVLEDKKLSLYPGGYHELHNEPDGVKEKFIEECISWVETHLPSSTEAPSTAKL